MTTYLPTLTRRAADGDCVTPAAWARDDARLEPADLHAVVALPRGMADDGRPGYAAPCVCGGITFGGFASPADARADLADCLAASRRDESGRFVGRDAR